MWFVHSVRRLWGGVQLCKDSKESMQELDAQMLPQQAPFLAVQVAFLAHKAPASLCVR